MFLDGDTKMIARCREASMGSSGTALSVRENWGWDWPSIPQLARHCLANREGGNCPGAVWIIFGLFANPIRFAVLHYVITSD